MRNRVATRRGSTITKYTQYLSYLFQAGTMWFVNQIIDSSLFARLVVLLKLNRSYRSLSTRREIHLLILLQSAVSFVNSVPL